MCGCRSMSFVDGAHDDWITIVACLIMLESTSIHMLAIGDIRVFVLDIEWRG